MLSLPAAGVRGRRPGLRGHAGVRDGWRGGGERRDGRRGRPRAAAEGAAGRASWAFGKLNLILILESINVVSSAPKEVASSAG